MTNVRLVPFNLPAEGPEVGRFAYQVAQDAWHWSDEIFTIHGYQPGEVTPCTQLVLQHMHPADVAGAWQSRDNALSAGQPFTFPHRIVTVNGSLRTVIAAGHLERDRSADPVLTGHLIDLTDHLDWARSGGQPALALVGHGQANPDLIAAALADIERTAAAWSPYALTERETQVLLLIAQGHSNDTIAQHLFLSINSVKTYIRTAYRKIGAQRRIQAALWVNKHV